MKVPLAPAAFVHALDPQDVGVVAAAGRDLGRALRGTAGRAHESRASVEFTAWPSPAGSKTPQAA